MENKKTITGIILTIVILIIVCLTCCCLVVVTTDILGQLKLPWQETDQETPQVLSPTTVVWPTQKPTLTDDPHTPEKPIIDGAQEALEILNNEVVPINDPIDLAERLGGKSDIPELFPDAHGSYAVGDKKSFWTSNTDTNQSSQITAVLRYLGDNIYFWIEEGVSFREKDLLDLANTFDQQIYPTTRSFFGSEWSPGVDEDPRIYVLYTGGLGTTVAGYFSPSDQLHPAAHIYSNAHEMFFISSDNVDLYEDYIYGTMAHEFQHMIHWYNDRNEDGWLNEGFSMLSELINGYDTGGFDYVYLRNTDLSLTDWGVEQGENAAHYGASFLFTTYFLDRFGVVASQTLVGHDENGMTSIDAVMDELDLLNPDTNLPYKSEEVFADWAVTNYLNDSSVDQGRYSYKSYEPMTANLKSNISECPEDVAYEVSQFGVNYIEITCPEADSITLTGIPEVKLLPFEENEDGNYFFWSNRGDNSNMRLSKTFDFSSTSSPIVMDYEVWYDLETDYDYVFLSASTDGETIEILNTPRCTNENPSGNSYGCGYNGQTGTWVNESVDLSKFAGQRVTLQFDYVTDAAVNGNGFAVDDIQIEAINYVADFQTDSGGWDGEGFVRLQNTLPQTYNLSVIHYGEEIIVEHFSVTEKNEFQIEMKIDDNFERIVLVISGTTPITREKAVYRLEVE